MLRGLDFLQGLLLMRHPLWTLVLIGIAFYGLVRCWVDHPRPASYGSPIVLGKEPFQEALPRPLSKLFSHSDDITRIELTHAFEIIGEAVSVAQYRWAFTNPYFEVDLGLAWGPRVESYKQKVIFRQTARWLMWSFQGEIDAATRFDIQSHVGNLHLIPAGGRPNIQKAIRSLEKGDRVRIKGYLVRIYGPAGNVVASSSTSREDLGDGACEIVWVEEIQIGKYIYK